MTLSKSRRAVLGGLFSTPFVMTSLKAMPKFSIGPMLLAGFRGSKADDPEVKLICDMLRLNSIAGVVLLQRNITSPEQLAALNAAFQGASGELPAIIAIDQEGGAVSRVKKANGFLDWGSARSIRKSKMSDEDISAYYKLRADELHSVGVNLNLAPVVDLDGDDLSPGVGEFGRSYSSQAPETTRLAELFIRAHHAAGLRISLKHFPGHGRARTDTHSGYADINETWTEAELAPYRDLVAKGLVDTVMQGHLLHDAFSDGADIPASLSRKSILRLRDEVGFQGPVITDSLQMKAISRQFSAIGALNAAINAGNSLIIYSDIASDYSPSIVHDMAEALLLHPGVNRELAEAEMQRVAEFRRKLAKIA